MSTKTITVIQRFCDVCSEEIPEGMNFDIRKYRNDFRSCRSISVSLRGRNTHNTDIRDFCEECSLKALKGLVEAIESGSNELIR